MTAKPVQQEGLVGSLQSEVAAEASPLLRFLIAHAVKIAVGIVLFIALIAAYWLYNAHSDSRRQAEARELGQYMIISDPALRLEKLEAYAPNAPESIKTPLAFAMMEAATALQDQDKIFAAWKIISERDALIRPTATLGMASSLANQGKFDQALSLLVTAAQGLTGGDSRNVNSRIIFLAEVTGDLDKALSACEALINQAPSPDEAVLWHQKRTDLEAKIKQAAAGADGAPQASDAGKKEPEGASDPAKEKP